MNPIDFRNETFRQLRERLSGLREQVANAWRTHGPGTTREVARKSGIDILNLRPRTTELEDLGFVIVAEDQASVTPHEGVYRARSEQEWAEWFAAQQHAAVSGQRQLI